MLYVPTEAHKEPPPMTSNPEQPNNIPTAGDNPNNAGHLSDIPYDNEPLDQHYKKDYELDTGQLDEIAQTGEFPPLPEGREPARELPLERPTAQPETNKSKKGLLVTLGVGAVGVATAFGAWFGATGGGTVNLPPTTQPTAEAPANPVPVVPGEVAPSPESSATYILVNESNVENYIKNYDEFAKSATLTAGEYPSLKESFPAIVNQINGLLNIELTEDEIASSKDLITEDGKTGPEALAAMKRDAYDELLPDAKFKGQLDKISESNFKYWLETRNDENPFKATFVPTGENFIEYKYINNAGKDNSLDPIATADVFRFAAATPVLGSVPRDSGDPSQRTWSLEPGTYLAKQGTTANQ